VRFDYQAVDLARRRLIIAHMNDASVVAVTLDDGAVVKIVPGVPVPRGVVVANEVGRVFVTSSPHSLVVLDADSLAEVARVPTGTAPDGVAWDSTHGIVGVSDQSDGALSLIADAGRGKRASCHVGRETGNVAFDAARGLFWIAVERSSPPDALVAVDPLAAKVVRSVPLPGCAAAHGILLHPDGVTAFVACEDNARLARVALTENGPALVLAPTGAAPDVLALDPELGWLYVAAESGDLTVFDVTRPGLVLVGRDHPADGSHSVAVDPTTHRVYFPLGRGATGAPSLRIMLPAGL
jgi:DNA-binding beta-propeller fold protein YncE